jgi:hypothetical protein
VLRESELFTDSPFNRAIHELGERMHRDHQERENEMFPSPQSVVNPFSTSVR